MNKNTLQAIKFTLFSISAAVIQLGSFALLHDVLVWEMPFQFPEWLITLFSSPDMTNSGDPQFYLACYLPALVLSVIWNFTFNRKYTFKPTNHVGRDMLLVLLYNIVFLCASCALSIWLSSLGTADWLLLPINMALNFVTEFLFQKFVVYREAK